MNLSWGADPPAGPHGAQWGTRQARPPSGAPRPATPARGEPGPLVDPVDRHHRMAAELAPMVGVWKRMLDAHQPDRNGRCRTCTQGGTGLPGTQWPCVLHGLAELARRRHGLAEGA